MIPYLARFLDISVNNMLSQVNGRKLFAKGNSIRNWKQNTGKLNLVSLQNCSTF